MVAVIIPSYKVKNHILGVIAGIGPEVQSIYVVDDACPVNSGQFVLDNNTDTRVKVVFNPKNTGVGGAVMHGYAQALADGATIMVKLDGDGQMDATLIPKLIKPILLNKADYVKGNRFFNPSTLNTMPAARLFGNSMLSLINKFVNGYWNIMDPTNGFTAIHGTALGMLPLDKIDNRYFFESDMLFRLGTINAVVYDMPMNAHYADEESGLSIRKVLLDFPPKYLNRFFKRIGYKYFIRDFNIGTLHLVSGLSLMIFGAGFGINYFIHRLPNEAAPTATVMIAVLPILLGFQLMLSFLNYDVSAIPNRPLIED